jgi:hypothetical protein
MEEEAMKTVVGVFETANAGGALTKLYRHGFKPEEVTVIDRDRMVRGPAFADSDTEVLAAAGAANTGGAGSGSTPSPMAVPVVGLAVLKGNMHDVLRDLGVGEEESTFYENTLKKRATLIVVRTANERAADAETTMRQSMASNVSQIK